jgi:PmbA protein
MTSMSSVSAQAQQKSGARRRLDDPEALVRLVLDQAIAAGADAAEVYFERSRKTMVRVQDGKPENITRADDAGLGLRVLIDHRIGFSATSRLAPEVLAAFARDTVELARLATPDEHAVLPAGGPANADTAALALVDPRLRDATVEEKMDLLVRHEQAARAVDPRLKTDFFIYGDQISQIHLASTRGVRVSYEAGECSITGTALTMSDGQGGGTEAMGSRAGRRFADLDERPLGRLVGERAIKMVGGRPLPPQPITVVFPPDFAAEVLAALAGALCGTSVVKGESFLAGRLDHRIGSDLWNVIDDGTLPGALGTAPADGEGIPCAYQHPIIGGRLASFLHDSYSAARMGTLSTGNAFRGGFRSPPGVEPRNLILTPGHRTPEELVAGIDRGLLVYQTIHTGGIDPVTGLYSVAAGGQLIEGGRLGRPVLHVTVASTLQEMLENLVAVGHDLEWSGTIAAPTLVFERMTVAGEG